MAFLVWPSISFGYTVQTEGQIEELNTLHSRIAVVASAYGQDPELAYAIAHCEGMGSKNAGNNTNYKNGNAWSRDIGFFQINDYHHKDQALKLGLDIYNPKDNIVYAMWLLSQEGTKPWNSSRNCWEKLV